MRLSQAQIAARMMVGVDDDPSVGDFVLNLAEDALTEERSDATIEVLLALIPLPLWLAWVKPILRKLMDKASPGLELKLLRHLLERVKLVDPPPSERRQAWPGGPA